MLVPALALSFLFLAAPAALAHAGQPPAPHDAWQDALRRWTFDPAVVLGLLAAALIYGRGAANAWRAAGRGRGVRRAQVASFYAGLGCVALALLSPVDALGGLLFSAHMVQHVLLMFAAAPLLAFGAPPAVWAWALPRGQRRGGARAFHRSAALRGVGRLLTQPFFVWAVGALALWLWHVPGPYQAALASDFVHALEHASFLGTALLFWWVLVRPAGRVWGSFAAGAKFLFVFTTMLHSGFLGALITFAPAPWYPAYLFTAPAFGLDALADQHLAGVLMWIPTGVAYLGAALALLVGSLRALERRDRGVVWVAPDLPIHDGGPSQ
jgi:putative membrane protein